MDVKKYIRTAIQRLQECLDEVEREPEIVEFRADIYKGAICIPKSVDIGDDSLTTTEPKLNVAVSKDKFSAIPGEVVASGEYHYEHAHRIDGETVVCWIENNAEPGDQITITRRNP